LAQPEDPSPSSAVRALCLVLGSAMLGLAALGLLTAWGYFRLAWWVRVPAAALVQRDGKDVAFALGDGGTVQLRAVKPGRALGDDRQVLSGLSPGDTVVLDPPAALADGSKVRVADDAARQ
jgi:hypothetical protein